MNSKTLLAVFAGAALSLGAAACGGGDNVNVNVNVNANRANANANANTNANANANANSRAGANWNFNTNRADFEKTASDWGRYASNLGDRLTQETGDGWIHFKVRGALAAADDLRDSTINVDVEKGVVTLRGSVATDAQKTKAADAAKKADEGVKNVVNQLRVEPAGGGNANGGNANTGGAGNANKKG